VATLVRLKIGEQEYADRVAMAQRARRPGDTPSARPSRRNWFTMRYCQPHFQAISNPEMAAKKRTSQQEES